jgi:hypothetical protein
MTVTAHRASNWLPYSMMTSILYRSGSLPLPATCYTHNAHGSPSILRIYHPVTRLKFEIYRSLKISSLCLRLGGTSNQSAAQPFNSPHHCPVSMIPLEIWKVFPPKTNGHEQPHCNVDRDDVGFTFLGGSTAIFDAFGTNSRNHLSAHAYCAKRSLFDDVRCRLL